VIDLDWRKGEDLVGEAHPLGSQADSVLERARQHVRRIDAALAQRRGHPSELATGRGGPVRGSDLAEIDRWSPMSFGSMGWPVGDHEIPQVGGVCDRGGDLIDHICVGHAVLGSVTDISTADLHAIGARGGLLPGYQVCNQGFCLA
jgi:hypothetical protein